MQRDWKPLDVPYHRLDEAADVLARAFASDRIITYFIPSDTPDRMRVLRELFKTSLLERASQNIPVLAAEWNNKIVAVTNLLPPFKPKPSESVERLWNKLSETLGAATLAKFDEYRVLREKHMPPRQHHYLVTIGVDPNYQGMGFGSALLEEVMNAVRADKTSAGTMLDTDGEKNRAFYERHGFSTIGKEDLGGTEILFMYRAVR